MIIKKDFDINTVPGVSDYVKKPIKVRAVQMDEDFSVETLEGITLGFKGDYLIRGIKGELYPCRKEIFNCTYGKLINAMS